MDADERDIVTYLKSWSGRFVSGREIARRAAGKRRYDKEPNWAIPILARMVEKGIIETDASAHFRLLPESKHREKKQWVSPEIKKLLEQAGKEFEAGAEIDVPEEPR
jgi:hypothetical protein